MENLPIYRVRDWDLHFENNRTRELRRLAWVPVPNKHDGDGYNELIDRRNGAAMLGAWIAIVQVASKCDPRGTLMRDGVNPHTPHSLARKTRLPATCFEAAIPVLMQIGWLEELNADLKPIPHEGAVIPQDTAQKGMEGKGIEGNGNKEEEAVRWTKSHGWQGITPTMIRGWAEAYPDSSIDQQLKCMAAWLVANPAKARKENWSRFIVNWLKREPTRSSKNDPASTRRRDDAGRQFPEPERELPVLGE